MAADTATESRRIDVEVNGTLYERDVEPRRLLIHFLRDDLDLTGSHVGCDTGNCGACSVIYDGTLEIGAMTTYSEIMASSEARARPILGAVCAQIADVQVRNRGTIGGNVCSNDPTNHLPPLMVALGAQLTIVGPDGERTVPAEEFFLGVYMTAVAPGELLTRIEVPAGRADGFAAVTIGRDGTCIVNAAASLEGEPCVALGCVDAVPVLIQPGSTDRAAIEQAVRDENLDPPSDVHASADYRRRLAEVVAARAVAQASERARS